MKVLIIGGVAAGTKAAAKLKRMNPAADVTILTKGKDISYAGCGLPYYVGGLIPEKEQLIVNTPAEIYRADRCKGSGRKRSYLSGCIRKTAGCKKSAYRHGRNLFL